MLSKANIIKAKGQSVSLLVFIMIAAMLINIGLLLLINFEKFFDDKVDELGAPHYVALEERRIYDAEQTEYLKKYKGVEKVEKEDVLSFMTDINYNDGEMPSVLVLSNISTAKGMSKPILYEGKEKISEKGIYLPMLFKVGGGYEVGDKFKVKLNDEIKFYNIEGFTEEISFGSLNNQLFRIYMHDKDYSELVEKYPNMDCVLQSVRLTSDPKDSSILNSDYTKEFFYDNTVAESSTKYFYSLDYFAVKEARTFLSDIMAMIMIAFASMVVLISLIVIRFRIKNSIEENIVNIGALKAMGYTGKQILLSYIIQFGGLSFVGVLLGLGASYAVLPAISRMMLAQTAIIWEQGFDLLQTSITFIAVMLCIILVTFACAYGVTKKIPLLALRSELNIKSYSKNNFPLSKSKGNLTFLLAIKSVFQSKGQSVMIAIIICIASFIAISGIAMYTNIGMNSKEFTMMIAGEMPDAAFFLKNSEDAPKLMKKFKDDKEVRTAYYSGDITLMVDGNESRTTITEDFSDYEGSYLYEGKYPQTKEEIAISSLLLDIMEKGIGDKIIIEQGEKKAEYEITGKLQTMNDGGRLVALTDAGVKEVLPDYKPLIIYLYLSNPDTASSFVKNVTKEEGEIFSSVIDMQELADTQLGVYNSIFLILAIVILAITLFIIFLVLFLVLKTMILRKSKSLGIYKATGFSTWNLVNQMSMNLLPMIVIGVMLGCVIGYLGFNPIMSALMGTMGIMKTNMIVSFPVTIVLCIALIIISWGLSMLISLRVRKISPIALIKE